MPKEQEVLQVANNQHISIGGARWQVMGANKDPSSSYASAIRKFKKNKFPPQAAAKAPQAAAEAPQAAAEAPQAAAEARQAAAEAP